MNSIQLFSYLNFTSPIREITCRSPLAVISAAALGVLSWYWNANLGDKTPIEVVSIPREQIKTPLATIAPESLMPLKSLIEQLRNPAYVSHSETMTIKHADGTIEDKAAIVKILGQGGCKRALEISKNRALIVPNTESDPMSEIAERWPRIVDEECRESAHRPDLKLLSLPLEKVEMCIHTDACIPAYLTETFEELERSHGWSIIDQKNSYSSIMSQKIFSSDEERMKPENWGPIVRPLIKDIENLRLHDLATQGDSVSVVVIREPDSKTPYARIVGFDFTSKFAPLRVPNESDYRERREFICALSKPGVTIEGSSFSESLEKMRMSAFNQEKDKIKTVSRSLIQSVVEMELIENNDFEEYFRVRSQAADLAKAIVNRFTDSLFAESCSTYV